MSNVIMIDTNLFIADDPLIVEDYEQYGYKDFPSYELFKEFFIEVGNNHPDGVDEGYFKQLYDNYTTSLSLKNLLDLGLVDEIIRENGTIGYKVRDEVG